MTTKIQKLFARLLRTENPYERKILKRKLRGVKASEVSYTKDGKRYTIHGNIPWTQPNDKKAKRRLERKPNTTQHSDPGTGPRRAEWIKPTPKPHKKTREEFLREESDFVAKSTIKRRNKGLF